MSIGTAIGNGISPVFLRPMGPTGLDAINWLLRDEFITPRAAGSVNGTASEPGPGGNRNTTDPNSFLSISSGWLIQSGGDSVVFSPRLSYDVVTRSAGLLLVSSATPLTVRGPDAIGFFPDTAQNGNYQGVLRFVGGGLQASYTTNGSLNIGAYVNSTNYNIAIVLRAAGAYYYIKGGIYTSWTLLYISSVTNNASVYPSVRYFSGTSQVDFIRIPNPSSNNLLQNPIAYDTFARADGALGNTETTGPDGQTTPAVAWTNQVGTTQVASNKAQATALSGGIAIATIPGTTTDVYMQSALTRAGDEVGITLRWADANNYLRAYHDGTNVVLDEVVAGVPNNLITVAAAYAASANLAVRLIGQGAYVWYNNAYIGNTAGINAALAGTNHGTYSTNIDNTNDNVLVMASTGYTQFDKYIAAS